MGTVVGRAMAKDPNDRFQTAGELGIAARSAARDAPPRAATEDGEPASSPDADATAPLPVAPAPPHAIRHRPPSDAPPPTASTRVERPGPRRRRGPLVAVALALLAAVAIVVAVSGGDEKHSPSPTQVPARPAERPPSGSEIRRLLQSYADRYHAEDATGLGELFTSDGIRRNGGDPPENRGQAVAAYRKQFSQMTSPIYTLSGLKLHIAGGAAAVTGRYRVTSGSGSVTGSIAFHLARQGGRLRIRRLDIRPG
jgi:serine/threonine-protein kinase